MLFLERKYGIGGNFFGKKNKELEAISSALLNFLYRITFIIFQKIKKI